MLDGVESLEGLVPLDQAANLLPHRVHISTIFRWQSRGVSGVKLQTVRIGGRRYVSREALQRFATESTSAARTEQAKSELPATRRRNIDAAERKLDGLLRSPPRRDDSNTTQEATATSSSKGRSRQ